MDWDPFWYMADHNKTYSTPRCGLAAPADGARQAS
jgi:hypothetical protein